jgi:hypothetical protein
MFNPSVFHLSSIISFFFGFFTYIIIRRNIFAIILTFVGIELFMWEYYHVMDYYWDYMQRLENIIFYFTGCAFSFFFLDMFDND